MIETVPTEVSKSERTRSEWEKVSRESNQIGVDPLDEIVARLDQLLARLSVGEVPNSASRPKALPQKQIGNTHHVRKALPDPHLVRSIIRSRQMRLRFFDHELFADPAWDMLLDLTAARGEHLRVSVTSLCIASGVPTTTALRWIKVLEQSGLVRRIEDEADRRRAFVCLTERGIDAMTQYFEEMAKQDHTGI